MQFNSGKFAEVTRVHLKEVAATDGINIDRLAIALSIRSPEQLAVGGVLDAADGARHRCSAVDRFQDGELFRPVLCVLAGRDLHGDEYRDLLRRHMNRGYDILFRVYQMCGRDWEACLKKLSPRRPAPAGAGATVAPTAIRVDVARDLETGSPVSWTFNREGGGQMNSNVRIAGMPGVGKSQFLMNLLAGVCGDAGGPGFILFDYKGDLADKKDFVEATHARVIRPGDEPIPINPFQLPENVNTVLAPRVFAETFRTLSPRIGPVQESALVSALERVYRPSPCGYDSEGPSNVVFLPGLDVPSAEGGAAVGERRSPTLQEIVCAVEDEYRDGGRAEDSVLSTLRDLANYRLFADRCERPLAETFAVRWIIDLASLQTLRNFVAFTVLEFLHQVARSLGDSGYDQAAETRRIRGVVAIDEAHYYLKAKCRPLLDLIRIGRSKGIPVFLSSQSLEDFRGHTEVNEFLPNAFLLKHGMPPDKRTIAGALHVDPAEAARLSARTTALDKFQALASLPWNGDGSCGVKALNLRGFWERCGK